MHRPFTLKSENGFAPLRLRLIKPNRIKWKKDNRISLKRKWKDSKTLISSGARSLSISFQIRIYNQRNWFFLFLSHFRRLGRDFGSLAGRESPPGENRREIGENVAEHSDGTFQENNTEIFNMQDENCSKLEMDSIRPPDWAKLCINFFFFSNSPPAPPRKN